MINAVNPPSFEAALLIRPRIGAAEGWVWRQLERVQRRAVRKGRAHELGRS